MEILIEQGILRGQVDELSKEELLSLYQRNNSRLDEQDMRAAILKKKVFVFFFAQFLKQR